MTLKAQAIINALFRKDFSCEKKATVASSVYEDKIVNLLLDSGASYSGKMVYMDDSYLVIETLFYKRVFVILDKIQMFWFEEDKI